MILKLKAKTRKIANISDSIIQQLFDLYDLYYEGTDYSHFKRDLKRKTKIILISNQNNEICGFSTLVCFSLNIQGKRQHVLYSGDTIIRQDCRGTSVLTFEFLKNITLNKNSLRSDSRPC